MPRKWISFVVPRRRRVSVLTVAHPDGTATTYTATGAAVWEVGEQSTAVFVFAGQHRVIIADREARIHPRLTRSAQK